MKWHIDKIANDKMANDKWANDNSQDDKIAQLTKQQIDKMVN